LHESGKGRVDAAFGVGHLGMDLQADRGCRILQIRLRGPEIDDEAEARRLDDRKIGGIGALEDAPGVDPALPELVGRLVP
jgi:hypothetical protein